MEDKELYRHVLGLEEPWRVDKVHLDMRKETVDVWAVHKEGISWPCPDLRALRRTSDRFLRYYHVQKPSRSLTLAEHGTRFPGVLRDRTWPTLRHLPDGFSLEPYIDARGHLAFPIARGRVSFVRKVDGHGCIEFNGAEYFIRRKLERQYVVATLSSHHRRIFIKYEGKLIKSVPFPFAGTVIDPLI
jgi:hypothetical protein